MLDKRPVDRHQLQVLDLRLGEQQLVERISRRRLGQNEGGHMGNVDAEDGESSILKNALHSLKRYTRIKFTKPRFDRNFPQAGNTDVSGKRRRAQQPV